MLQLEDFMEIQKLHHDGLSGSEIARQLKMDRKTVRKYLKQGPREYERQAKKWKVDPFRAYLRERWELGVHNAAKLLGEIRKRGYRIYPSMKALLHAAPAWLVAVLLWSLSRIRSFRELLATGVNECRALVDVFLFNASEVLGPVAVRTILAMKPVLEGAAQPSLEK